MRRLTLLGLCAVAAMAWTASIGAGSSSATVLCTEYKIECPVHYPVGYEFEATLEAGATSRVTDTSGFITLVTCTESTIKGITENTGSEIETIGIELETLSFGGCTNKTTVLLAGRLELDYLAGSNTEGTMTAEGQRITMEVSGLDCVYGFQESGSDIGKVTGTNPTTLALGKIHVNTSMHLLEGQSCPSSVKWTTTYTITYPAKVFIKNKRK